MKSKSKRKSARKLTAVQTSRHFRLVHARHSGRILPKRSTSYPTLAMIVLCVGVFLASWTNVVTADDSYDVLARVEGVAPTQPATIDSPLSGASFTAKPIDVSGTCPASTYVEIFRNNVASGSALCDGGGLYTVSIDLFSGSNNLIARVYNLADVPGPDSSPIEVTYTAPTPPPVDPEDPTPPPASQPASTPASTPKSNPMYIKYDYQYKGYNAGELVTFEIDLVGGVSPYAISVEWGDGKKSLYSRSENGKIKLEHTYDQAEGDRSKYVIKVSITDGRGETTYTQFFVMINNNHTSGFKGLMTLDGVTGSISGLTTEKFGDLVKYIWPGYGIVLLMLISFWLGEMRELRLVKARSVHKPHKYRRSK